MVKKFKVHRNVKEKCVEIVNEIKYAERDQTKNVPKKKRLYILYEKELNRTI